MWRNEQSQRKRLATRLGSKHEAHQNHQVVEATLQCHEKLRLGYSKEIAPMHYSELELELLWVGRLGRGRKKKLELASQLEREQPNRRRVAVKVDQSRQGYLEEIAPRYPGTLELEPVKLAVDLPVKVDQLGWGC